ncbi:MAG: cytochrome-c peroxidase [Planctomycetaceae bacterium]|nr:cytochrome-c peroxidase [Planctomycetaceae bacterium]
MGRFLAIVIALVAIALLINSSLNKKDDPVVNDGANDGATVAPTDEQSSTPSSDTPSADSGESSPKSAEDDAQSKESSEPETVLLGSGDLLTGIPGKGDLTDEQIDAWVADAKNHVPLKPELPLGLAAGAAGIQGLDENPLTRAKIELGRQLYFDTRLSSDNTVSCASCHDPAMGFAKDTQFGVGVDGQEGGRNSPVAYNRILSGPQFWDGRAATLEAQAVGPIANPIEMANTHENAVKTVAGIAGYKKQFEAIFDDGINIDNIGRAIASFERAVVTNASPWDRYQELSSFEKTFADDIEVLEELKEDDEELYDEYMALREASAAHPISESAIRGGKLFFGDKAGCTACHVGANFTDEKYHNLGVGMTSDSPEDIDMGRFAETNNDKDRGAFKTPTVRNVSLTGPYMHDGSQKTLLEVIEWYAKGGHANEHLSENIKPLKLSEQEKKDLVAFMAEGLLGEFPKVETGRLPL